MKKVYLFICMFLTLHSGILRADANSDLMKVLLYIESPEGTKSLFLPTVTRVTISERNQTLANIVLNIASSGLYGAANDGSYKEDLHYLYDIDVETSDKSKFSFEGCEIIMFRDQGMASFTGRCKNKDENNDKWVYLDQFMERFACVIIYNEKRNKMYNYIHNLGTNHDEIKYNNTDSKK